MVALPVARSAARSTVNDQVLGAFGDFFVQVVLKHSQCGLLCPSFARELATAGGPSGDIAGMLHFGGYWHNHKMLVGAAAKRKSASKSV